MRPRRRSAYARGIAPRPGWRPSASSGVAWEPACLARGERWLPKAPEASVDTTEAGDAFAAVLAATAFDAQVVLPRGGGVRQLLTRLQAEW
jgi:hypothetical protein